MCDVSVSADRIECLATNECVAADIITGDVVVINQTIDANLINVIMEKYLPIIIQDHLPFVMEKYGDKIAQALVNMFIPKND